MLKNKINQFKIGGVCQNLEGDVLESNTKYIIKIQYAMFQDCL